MATGYLTERSRPGAERTSSAARETGRSRKRWEWAASRPLISRCTSSSTHCNATGFSSAAAAAEDWSGRGLRGRGRGRSRRHRGRRRCLSSLAPPAPRSPLRREASRHRRQGLERKGSIGEEGGEEAEPSPGATSGIGSRAEGAMSRERPGKRAGSHLLRGPCAATSDLLAGHASTIQEGVAQALACARGAHNFFPTHEQLLYGRQQQS